ncbi:MAG: hydroxymethylbilane synthase [Spirosomataceae bacterium]
MHIKIGTRGSKLALWQAYYIQDKLEKAGATTEICLIETKGDKILDRALSKIGSKGVFTEELEEQLLSGAIDIAVHSAKDLQSTLADTFEIIAFTERENTADVLISNQPELINRLHEPLVIGTSSTRRIAMLKRYFPHFQVVDMRGNLQTRIAKMESGACDALLLAYAGVHRMGYEKMIIHRFDNQTFIPPVGQGTVAVECAISLDQAKRAFVRAACNEESTEICLRTERAYLKELQGGCSIPVFGYAQWVENQVHFNAGIVSLDGQEWIQKQGILTDEISPENLGKQLADEVLKAGGQAILTSIKNQM